MAGNAGYVTSVYLPINMKDRIDRQIAKGYKLRSLIMKGVLTAEAEDELKLKKIMEQVEEVHQSTIKPITDGEGTLL